jgi:hypothetical protein
VFDETGHAFIQLARAIGSHSGSLNSEVVLETLASSFTAYFGTYTVIANGTKLSIEVQGSNRPAYVGSTQERAISIAEDTLTMGQPDQYRAVLDRQES